MNREKEKMFYCQSCEWLTSHKYFAEQYDKFHQEHFSYYECIGCGRHASTKSERSLKRETKDWLFEAVMKNGVFTGDGE